MDPATMEQLVKIARGIKGEIPISTIIMVILLAAFIGERIWDKVLKTKALRMNNKGGSGKNCQPTAENVADKVVEEQAVQSHYKTTEDIKTGVEGLCRGNEVQTRTMVRTLTVLEHIEKNTKGFAGRKK